VRLGNVAVVEPVWLVTVSVMLVYVTLTRTGVMFALGQVNPAVVIGVVETVKDPLPFLVVGKLTVPLVVVVDLTSPDGSLFSGGVKQPRVTVAVAERLAVPPVLPAPATSPVAVKVDWLFKRVAVTVGAVVKCRPPVRVVFVAVAVAVVAASAGTAARAITSSDSTAIMPIFLIMVFLLYLVGLYCSLRTGACLRHRLRAVECLFAGAGRTCVALSIDHTSVRPLAIL
jgi:hypothetical protein